MKLKVFKIASVAAFLASGTFVSCVADDNSPGLEYMPDMYRSPAVEAYVDYGEVDGRYNEDAQNLVEEKFSYLPPMGTIPHNSNGTYLAPYEHGAPKFEGKSQGLFEAAIDENGLDNSRLDLNPIPYTEEIAAEGKELYGQFCIHCHGEKGAGDGPVITNSGDKFPPPPAYKKTMPAGEMVYIMTYGKGAMGSHSSQVSLEERWILAHYVEKLAGKDKEFEQALLFDSHTDTDGDGVMDSEDESPEVAGTIANKGSQEVAPEIKAITDNADINVVFQSGSIVIQEGSYPSLDRLLVFMQENNNFNLIINGHTDSQGDENGNKILSLSRAQMAKTYLSEKGIDKARIKVYGYGEFKPVATNSTEEGRLANRRVEFRLYK